MATKVSRYRILHHFNQDGKLAVQHIYYPQCKVLFFWHTIGQAKANRVAIEQILLHENATKNMGFFGRLWEVWKSKFFAK